MACDNFLIASYFLKFCPEKAEESVRASDDTGSLAIPAT